MDYKALMIFYVKAGKAVRVLVIDRGPQLNHQGTFITLSKLVRTGEGNIVNPSSNIHLVSSSVSSKKGGYWKNAVHHLRSTLLLVERYVGGTIGS